MSNFSTYSETPPVAATKVPAWQQLAAHDQPSSLFVRTARVQLLVRLVLGLCWLYQGVLPKLLFPDTGELRMLQRLGVSLAGAHQAATIAGIGEAAFGLLFWLLPPRGLSAAYWLNIIGLIGLAGGALASQPAVFVAPFNPFSLNLSMLTLAAVGLLTLPSQQSGLKQNVRQAPRSTIFSL